MIHAFACLLRPVPLALLVLASAAPAGASALRWEQAANGAAIVLPVPARGAAGITGGSLFCRAQEWSFLLRTDRAVAATMPATLTVGSESFTLRAEPAGGAAVSLALPREALTPLRDGVTMRIAVGEGEEALSARFPLAGSGNAIKAASPLCSAPEVAGFDAVALEPSGEAALAAVPLIAEEAALFREAAGKEPVVTAAFVPAETPRRMLFVSLCGSERYYGETGCKLVGFASETAAGEWKAAYETDGMYLFTDPRRSHDGWPDLMTLPLGGEGGRLRWTWEGGAYQLQDDAAVAGDGPGIVDELRTSATGGG